MVAENQEKFKHTTQDASCNWHPVFLPYVATLYNEIQCTCCREVLRAHCR